MQGSDLRDQRERTVPSLIISLPGDLPLPSRHPGKYTAVCAELSPLNVKVEKGSVSRIMPRPIKGSYLSVNGTVPKANPDEFQRISSDTGLVLVQYTASGTTNTKFTAIMGRHRGLLLPCQYSLWAVLAATCLTRHPKTSWHDLQACNSEL